MPGTEIRFLFHPSRSLVTISIQLAHVQYGNVHLTLYFVCLFVFLAL